MLKSGEQGDNENMDDDVNSEISDNVEGQTSEDENVVHMDTSFHIRSRNRRRE
jgi:hypothetical protein